MAMLAALPALMAAAAPVMTIASGALTAIGTIAAGNAAAEQGRLAQQAAEFEAKQLDIKGKDEKAAAQREMLELRRQKEGALSRLQATSAASGFSATDPTTLSLADEVAKYGTYQEQTALYGGDVRQRNANLAAAGKRFEGARELMLGESRRTASYLNATGTILGSLSTLGTKYGKPTAASSAAYRYGT